MDKPFGYEKRIIRENRLIM